MDTWVSKSVETLILSHLRKKKNKLFIVFYYFSIIIEKEDAMAHHPLRPKPDFKRYDPKDPMWKWVLLFILLLIVINFFAT